METTIKEFLNSFDYSTMPIGPQASLVEDVETLNRLIPQSLKEDGNYPESVNLPYVKLGITKKFTWNRGTVNSMKAVKDYFDGVLLRKNYSIGTVTNLWERPTARRYNYQHKRFKDLVYVVDNTLSSKRRQGAVWLEDGEELDSIINGIIQGIGNSIEGFKNYFDTSHGLDCKCNIIYTETVDSAFELEMNSFLAEMWKKDNTDSYIILKKHDTREHPLYSSRIIVLHQFPGLFMNIFHGDKGLTPLFKFPIGKIIISCEMTMEDAIRSVMGTAKTNPYYNTRTRTWHRPKTNGLKHPYINIGNLNLDHRHLSLDACFPEYMNPQHTCAGNMQLEKPLKELSWIGWAEEAYNWLSSYRIGTTHPLNEISNCFYGNPSVIDNDLDDMYLDLVGWDPDRCHSHLINNLPLIQTNLPSSLSVCKNMCDVITRSNCKGYNADLREIDIQKVLAIFKESEDPYANRIPDVCEVIPPEMDDMSIHIQINEDTDTLEAAMLQWINEQTEGGS